VISQQGGVNTPGGGEKVTPGGVGGTSCAIGGTSIETGRSAASTGARASTRLAGGAGTGGATRSGSTAVTLCLVLTSSPSVRSPGERLFISSARLFARSTAADARSTPVKLAIDSAEVTATVRAAPLARSIGRRRARARRRSILFIICALARSIPAAPMRILNMC